MIYLKEAVAKTYERNAETTEFVQKIISQVQEKGDSFLLELSKQFDGADLAQIRVSEETIREAYGKVEPQTIEHLQKAAAQIRFYAEKQLQCLQPMEVESPVEGVTLGHRLIPVSACGAYVPGGRYPLPSTALMLAIPAKIAGVKRVVACSPASKTHGMIHPAVLVAMDIAGVDEVYCVGGAQAVGAMAYGTESLAPVDLIVGPGNRFVTEAKRQVLGQVGIDSLAGPSEVLVIADESANPTYIAIDLLAQSEHDPNARATLVTTSNDLAKQVFAEIEHFTQVLSTGEAAKKSWEDNGVVMLVADIKEAIDIANEMAPEHLQVQTNNEAEVSRQLYNYGSLFIGAYTPVAFGDYCSGTNHTLPTMRTARYSNGVWVGTFIKTSFHQHITETGCRNLSATGMHLAGVEGLFAHQMSVKVRVE